MSALSRIPYSRKVWWASNLANLSVLNSVISRKVAKSPNFPAIRYPHFRVVHKAGYYIGIWGIQREKLAYTFTTGILLYQHMSCWACQGLQTCTCASSEHKQVARQIELVGSWPSNVCTMFSIGGKVWMLTFTSWQDAQIFPPLIIMPWLSTFLMQRSWFAAGKQQDSAQNNGPSPPFGGPWERLRIYTLKANTNKTYSPTHCRCKLPQTGCFQRH